MYQELKYCTMLRIKSEAHCKHLTAKIDWLREMQNDLKEEDFQDIIDSIDDKIDELMSKVGKEKRAIPE